MRDNPSATPRSKLCRALLNRFLQRGDLCAIVHWEKTEWTRAQVYSTLKMLCGHRDFANRAEVMLHDGCIVVARGPLA